MKAKCFKKGNGEIAYGYKWQYANEYNSDRETA